MHVRSQLQSTYKDACTLTLVEPVLNCAVDRKGRVILQEGTLICNVNTYR